MKIMWFPASGRAILRVSEEVKLTRILKGDQLSEGIKVRHYR